MNTARPDPIPSTSRGLPWLTLAPLPAIAVGALVAAGAGVGPLAFAPNAAAALIGWGACWTLARTPSRTAAAARVAPWLALLLLAATLLGPGSQGVHRWVALGPLRLNASAALAPWLLLGLISRQDGVRAAAAAAVVATQLLHVAQPDAAQATALALGAAPLLASRRVVPPALGIPALLLAAGAAALAWARPDPLQPVAHVEGILLLARDQGPLALLGALVALGLALLPLAWAARGGAPGARRAAAGASLYFLASIGATFAGHFPVPLLGAGAGPVLGWCALALLAAAAARD